MTHAQLPVPWPATGSGANRQHEQCDARLNASRVTNLGTRMLLRRWSSGPCVYGCILSACVSSGAAMSDGAAGTYLFRGGSSTSHGRLSSLKSSAHACLSSRVRACAAYTMRSQTLAPTPPLFLLVCGSRQPPSLPGSPCRQRSAALRSAIDECGRQSTFGSRVQHATRLLRAASRACAVSCVPRSHAVRHQQRGQRTPLTPQSALASAAAPGCFASGAFACARPPAPEHPNPGGQTDS